MNLALTAQPGIKLVRSTVAALLVCLLMLGLSPAAPAASEGAARLVSVIVQGFNGSAEAAEAVESVGGKVVRDLSIINGVSAKVPADALTLLETNPSVFQVSEDAKIGFHIAFDGSKTAHQLTKITNASKLWSQGITGRGVTVALVDTGVYNHPDLAGRVVCGADFTAESTTPAACQDTFGHGTFMAGQIAGNGASSDGKYKGSAPEANIVSVKAAPYDGSTDVSTILASIQWVVAHKDEYGIDVLNLSLGSDSSQDYKLSPLNYAVEKAWSEGIVVVVSAGNNGPDAGTINKPGDDPYVITVGSSNHEGTVGISDDQVPVFSARGPTRANGLAKPDVVAPGVHTVSLRSPGSAIDNNYGSTAALPGDYFKGTGTSMSTAYTSGVVAQILQRNPGLTPDQVKHRLMSTARAIAQTDPHAAGQGLVDAYAAATSSSLLSANQGIPQSSGLGSLALDRGSIDVEVVTPAGQLALTGEFTAQTNPNNVSLSNPGGLVPFSSLTYTTSGWDGTSWRGTSWRTDEWAGTSWRGTSWRATVWDGTSWRGTSWRNEDWDGTSWRNTDWDGTSWRGTSWRSAWYAAGWE
ncbi:MAG: S8 family serine peptidase [Actinomycetota bacterium]